MDKTNSGIICGSGIQERVSYWESSMKISPSLKSDMKGPGLFHEGSSSGQMLKCCIIASALRMQKEALLPEHLFGIRPEFCGRKWR
jgi:hypothetical protein